MRVREIEKFNRTIYFNSFHRSDSLRIPCDCSFARNFMFKDNLKQSQALQYIVPPVCLFNHKRYNQRWFWKSELLLYHRYPFQRKTFLCIQIEAIIRESLISVSLTTCRHKGFLITHQSICKLLSKCCHLQILKLKIGKSEYVLLMFMPSVILVLVIWCWANILSSNNIYHWNYAWWKLSIKYFSSESQVNETSTTI